MNYTEKYGSGHDLIQDHIEEVKTDTFHVDFDCTICHVCVKEPNCRYARNNVDFCMYFVKEK